MSENTKKRKSRSSGESKIACGWICPSVVFRVAWRR